METAQTTMQEVQELIKRVRMDPKANNKPVLAVNVQALQTAKNGGYPKHMYHERLDSIVAMNEDEERALNTKGYVTHYIARQYPKWKYRRNMDARFFDQPEPQSNGSVKMVPNPFGDYVEAVEVKDEHAEAALLKRHAPGKAGKWFDKVTDLEPLPDDLEESPEVTKARLEGQLAELRTQIENRKTAKG
jgi:hypothetical protein